MSQSPEAIGMFWFRNAREYEEFLTILPDAAKLPSTYSSWLRQANQGHTHLLRQGHLVVKAQATPKELTAWASRTGHDIDAKGRMAFAAGKAAEYVRKVRGHE